MRFIETPVFTKLIIDLLDDESYRALQCSLLFRPNQGKLIQGSGGLRIIRWYRDQIGKRGGIRIIYFIASPADTLYMLFAYSKNELENLTRAQLRILNRMVREELQ